MQTLRSLEALEREGLVAPDPRLAEAAESMAISLTPEMATLIDRGDLAHDPIARQFVPSAQETEIAPEELERALARGFNIFFLLGIKGCF